MIRTLTIHVCVFEKQPEKSRRRDLTTEFSAENHSQWKTGYFCNKTEGLQ